MVAFDNFTPAHMCSPSPIVYSFHWDNIRAENLRAVVFSLNDKGMKSCGKIDSDDVLRYAFPKGAVQAHIWMLYRQIAEIHHMLSDGTVRVLATNKRKLENPIILTQSECIERETTRVRIGNL